MVQTKQKAKTEKTAKAVKPQPPAFCLSQKADEVEEWLQESLSDSQPKKERGESTKRRKTKSQLTVSISKSTV